MPNAQKITTESPELADRFNRVLTSTVEALEEAGLKYVFIGGIAASGLGRPRSTHDIDVFVQPEDAELALRALAKKGFTTEKTDPVWLYKGWKDDILVDVIFKSKGEIYFDSEMYQRVTTAQYHGRELRLVGPEDLVIIKSLAHSEVTPNHWHDALALLSHAAIDWEYLIRRARKAPRRILSLLLYAQSADISVPKSAIDQLYVVVFGDMPPTHHQSHFAQQAKQTKSAPAAVFGASDNASASSSAANSGVNAGLPGAGIPASATPGFGRTQPALRAVPKNGDHGVAHLRERLAEDSRTNELDIQIERNDNRFLLRGEVGSHERRNAVETICRECFPDHEVENQVRVTEFKEPNDTEEVSK